MKTHDEKVGTIEKVLKLAYLRRQHCPVKSEWEKRVMSHVLYLNTTPFQVSMWDTPILWKAAAAVSMSALIILAYSFTANIGPEYEAARMFLDDPMGIISTQLLFP